MTSGALRVFGYGCASFSVIATAVFGDSIATSTSHSYGNTMATLRISLLSCALLLSVSATPALAASSTASMASDSASTSIGSVSDSFGKSSDSSGKTNTAAAGDYKIVELAAAPDRPGVVRMKLQALAQQGADNELFLYLPQAVAEQSRLAAGDTVSAIARPYGLAFANGQSREEFFLVLNDDWLKELQTNPVTL